MGYESFVLVTIENLDELDKKYKDENYENIIKILRNIRTKYNELIKKFENDHQNWRGHYLDFGSDIYGPNYGDDEGLELVRDFIEISKNFPELIFGLYEFTYDYMNLEIYHVKGNECINHYHMDISEEGSIEIKVPKNILRFKIRMEDINLEGNITFLFNNEYKIECGLIYFGDGYEISPSEI